MKTCPTRKQPNRATNLASAAPPQRVLSALLGLACALCLSSAAAQPLQPEVLRDFEILPPEKAALVQASDGNFYGTIAMGGQFDGGAVFRVSPSGSLTVLVTFTGPNGAAPIGKLLPGRDGNLYGVTRGGGLSNQGTLFRVSLNGDFTTLVSFAAPNGTLPSGDIVQDSDGNFYGTTFSGGPADLGTIFRFSPAGQLATLATFNGTNGMSPWSGLSLGPDGLLYGVTRFGGPGFDGTKYSGYGTVFSVSTQGLLTSVASFGGPAGAYPMGTLAVGPDGALYGTCNLGFDGTYATQGGTVFRLTTDGVLSLVASFSNQDTKYPNAGLTLGNDGNFYGVTEGGGYNESGGFDYGAAFRVSPAGALTVLYEFTTNGVGLTPGAALALGRDGSFYGTTVSGGDGGDGSVFRLDPDGTLTAIAPFISDGAEPKSIVQGSDGNFYGITDSRGPGAAGTVFKMTPDGGEITTLAAFNWQNTVEPAPTLIEANPGEFYGAADRGGFSQNLGTIFRVTSGGDFKTIFSFMPDPNFGDPPNGGSPGGLIKGSDGFLYGTTQEGLGTIFRVTTNGVLTTLVRFDSDYGPSPLVEGRDGNFYVATTGGDTNQFGAVFRLGTDGTLTTLAAFSGTNGSAPNSLTLGPDGNLYGTTRFGGVGFDGRLYTGHGTIFKVTPDGTLTSLWSFSDADAGANGPLMLASDGNFYGCTVGNFQYWSTTQTNCGGVFQLTPAGAFTIIATFNGTNGFQPERVIQAKDGNLYGTTAFRLFDLNRWYIGGGNGGNIFRLNTAPRITAQPDSQTVQPGASFTFTVAADGLAPFTYQWLRNGSPIPGATDPSLTLSNVGKSDEAAYSVLVSNGFGSVTSSNAILQVQSADPRALLLDLTAQVRSSEIKHPEGLLARLHEAQLLMDRNHPAAAASELKAFQNTVRAQLRKSNPALAENLIASADEIIQLLPKQNPRHFPSHSRNK